MLNKAKSIYVATIPLTLAISLLTNKYKINTIDNIISILTLAKEKTETTPNSSGFNNLEKIGIERKKSL